MATSHVELYISCQNLPNLDLWSKSDPFAILYERDHQSHQWNRIGRTETIQDNLNPTFTKQFVLKYYFEHKQDMKVEIYDEDCKKGKLKRQEKISQIEFTLAKVMTSPGATLVLDLPYQKKSIFRSVGRHQSIVTIRGEEIAACRDTLNLQFAATNLPRMDGILGKADPFIVLQRLRENGVWIPVWQSETIKDSLDPEWEAFEISVQALCNGDYSRPLRIEVYDADRKGKSEFIGRIDTTLHKLTLHPVSSYDLTDPENQNLKKSSQSSQIGTLAIKKFDLYKKPTFLDYLRGGCEVQLIVGIDFSKSNGDFTEVESLHFIAGEENNAYERALKTAGEILGPYDADQEFQVYGFGARITEAEHVPHTFTLTLDDNPSIAGVDKIMEKYNEALSKLEPLEPTLIAPLIRKACTIASQHSSQKEQKYFVLMVLTDGQLDDYQEAVDVIVRGTKLPLSIVFVAIGDKDFMKLEKLDGDKQQLRAANGTIAARDIVQFVPFNKAIQRNRLTQELLAEIPSQLLDYMEIAGICPNPSLAPLTPASDPSPPSSTEEVPPSNNIEQRVHPVAGMPLYPRMEEVMAEFDQVSMDCSQDQTAQAPSPPAYFTSEV